MKSSCPVPIEQLPINEYSELKESWFFRWAALSRFSYYKPIVILWLVGWLVAAPVASASFSLDKYLLKFALSAAAGAAIIPLLALIQLYSGWMYVYSRLNEPTVPYEESGWYDGQLWHKPDQELQRDRLIVSYQLKPLLKKLQKTLLAIGLLLLGDLLLFLVF
ncbi:MAG: CGLD27 family protein [Cyanobacteria bacterium P01_A01_bin.135]